MNKEEVEQIWQRIETPLLAHLYICDANGRTSACISKIDDVNIYSELCLKKYIQNKLSSEYGYNCRDCADGLFISWGKY